MLREKKMEVSKQEEEKKNERIMKFVFTSRWCLFCYIKQMNFRARENSYTNLFRDFTLMEN